MLGFLLRSRLARQALILILATATAGTFGFSAGINWARGAFERRYAADLEKAQARLDAANAETDAATVRMLNARRALEQELEEARNDAEQDPHAARVSRSADSVQRSNAFRDQARAAATGSP